MSYLGTTFLWDLRTLDGILCLVSLRHFYFKYLHKLSCVSLWYYVGGSLSRRYLCLFWRETKQRPELEISTRLEVGKGTPVRSWKKEPTGNSWRRATERGSWQSTPDNRRHQSAWDRVHHQWGKTSQDELAFLVAWWKFREGCTSALVYRCTKECRVSQLNLLALELTQALIVRLFFVLFSPTPLVVFLVAMKKCAIPYRNH